MESKVTVEGTGLEVMEKNEFSFKDGTFHVTRVLLRRTYKTKNGVRESLVPVSFAGRFAGIADRVEVGDIVNFRGSLSSRLNKARTYRFVDVNGFFVEIVGHIDNSSKTNAPEEPAPPKEQPVPEDAVDQTDELPF